MYVLKYWKSSADYNSHGTQEPFKLECEARGTWKDNGDGNSAEILAAS